MGLKECVRHFNISQGVLDMDVVFNDESDAVENTAGIGEVLVVARSEFAVGNHLEGLWVQFVVGGFIRVC